MPTDPMHYAENGTKAFDRRAVCGSGQCQRITTDRTVVTCLACRMWLYEQEHKEKEAMPKDPKTTVEDLRRTANELLARAAEIEREEKAKAIPEEPPVSAGNTFKLIVRFRGSVKLYTYLLVRKPSGSRGGPWYTTGTGDTGYFENWTKLIEWLRSDNVLDHSALVRMTDADEMPTFGKPTRYKLGGKQR